MKTTTVLCASAFGFACLGCFFLGREASGAQSAEQSPSVRDSGRSTVAPIFERTTISEGDAVRIARESLCGIDSDNLAEPVVLTLGRFKLVSFRIFRNQNDPRPHGPETWHSPVWIDTGTGSVVPPQMPDWKPMSNSDIKAFLTEWSPSLKRARNWTWSIDHVSGFARVRIRDTVSPPPDPMEEDGKPAAFEYWIDETRKAEVCAYEL